MKLFNKSEKGFTLIELLVVVAIIGILAATILASLGQARAKARLSRAQSELSSMRAAAELYYSEKGAYYISATDNVFTGPTAASSGMTNLKTSMAGAGFTTGEGATASQWAFSFTTPGTGPVIYCADSNGYSGKSSTAASSTATQCTPI